MGARPPRDQYGGQGVGGGGDCPMRIGVDQGARAVGQSLRQVDPVGAQGGGQMGVGANQEHQTTPGRDDSQPPTSFKGVRRAERTEDNTGAGGQPRQHRLWIRRADRIGEEQQRRQGLFPAPASA